MPEPFGIIPVTWQYLVPTLSDAGPIPGLL